MDIVNSLIYSKNNEGFGFSKDDKYISIVSRKSVLLLRACFTWGACYQKRYNEIYDFRSKYKRLDDSWNNVFINQNNIDYEYKSALKKISKDKNYLLKIVQNCQEDGADL